MFEHINASSGNRVSVNFWHSINKSVFQRDHCVFKSFSNRIWKTKWLGNFSQARKERMMLKLRLKYENYQGWRCEVFTAHWWFVCSCVVGRLTARFCLGVSRCQAALWLGNPPPLFVVVQCVYSPWAAAGQKRPLAGPEWRRLCGSALVPASPSSSWPQPQALPRPAWPQPQDTVTRACQAKAWEQNSAGHCVNRELMR